LREGDGTGKAASQVNVALSVYAAMVVVLTAASWAVYVRIQDFMTRPLFTKSDQFRDLTNYLGKTAHLYRGATELGKGLPVFNYPAPAAFLYKVLLHTFPGHPVRPYLCFLAVCVLGFAVVTWRACRAGRGVWDACAAAIGVTAILGYPMLFTADRGNIEGFVWALAAAGLCLVLRARYGAGAILIGVAASIKPFSILYFLLLLRRGKFKDVAFGVGTTGVLVLAALVALGPNPLKAYRDLNSGMSLYIARYVTNLMPLDEARFDHSILDGMKSAALTVEMRGIRPHKAVGDVERLRAEPGGWRRAQQLARIYPLVAFAGLAILLAVFYKKPMLNQLTALGAAVTLFPPSAGEYTLLHLYVPFGALVVFLVREVATGKATLRYRSMVAFAAIYALLFSPLTFLMIYAGDAKLLLLIALLVFAARTPMPSAYFDDPVSQNARDAGRSEAVSI
jgi:hypothetical protein